MASSEKCVLVIGAGTSGVSSALELANAGFVVYLLEREAAVGGHAASFCCKATDMCSRCSACVASDKTREAIVHPNIRLLTSARLTGLSGEPGGFLVEITREPGYIDEESCIACGLCGQACPTDPRAVYPAPEGALPFSYVLDEGLCLRWRGEDCKACREACPTEAIAFERTSRVEELGVGAVIIATGFEVFDAAEKGSLGYGRYPNVLTGLDLERAFSREGHLTLRTNGQQPRSVAFIQCVGSRDRNHGYCSQVCCKYAMRLGGLIRHQNPDTEITVFYIDLQTAGKGFARFHDEYKESMRFIRGVPVEILQTTSGELEVKFEDISRGLVGRDTFDLVVLSVGLSPRRDAWGLARTLGITLGGDGFFDGGDSPGSNETGVEGIFLAGTCQGPRDIPDSVAHGIAAASRAMRMLGESAARPEDS